MTQTFCKLIQLIIAIIVLAFVPDSGAGEHAGRGGWGAHESVYRVKCRIANPKDQKLHRDVDMGTAFGHKSGNVLSANHVVDPCIKAAGTFLLVSAEGADSPATVVSRDDRLDLVLLKPKEGFVKSPLSISVNDTNAMGSQVSSWGFPSGYTENTPLLTVGYLAGVSPDHSNTMIKRWVINAAVNKGNSGGPLLETATSLVIGVVIQKYSPLTPGVESKLKGLSRNGGAEISVLAQAMIDIAERSQLVIGQAVITTDLRAFLTQAGVEP